MTDIELQGPIDTEKDRVKVLVDSLPTHFPKNEESENYQLFGAVGEVGDRVVEDIEEVHLATRVQEAQSIAELRELGRLVDLRPQQNEATEHYRTRLLGSFQNVTSQGTINDLLTNTAYVLDISIENVEYQETETSDIVVNVPKKAVDDSELDSDEIFSILEQNVAAGKTLRSVVKGTFEYISVEDYNNDSHDPDAGYAGLDADGNITSGGTYSTTMN